MNIAIFLIVIACIFAVVVFAYKLMFGKKNGERVVTKDPAAQAEYSHTKHKEEEKEQALTMQEKIELSWKFLTDVAQQVANKFSTQDKQQVQEAGEKLTEYGMKYEHNVHQEVKLSQSKVKSLAKTKVKSQEMSR